jgi:hypothetical protein
VPNPGTHTVSFYVKLFRAWAAMGFRTPKVDFVNGSLATATPTRSGS